MNFDTQRLENSEIQLIDGDRGKHYPKQADFNEEGHCLFLSAKNVTLKGFEFSETSFIDAEKDEVLRAGKLQRGDIVVTTRGTIGNISFYGDDIPYDHIRINSGMMIFRPDKNRWNNRFLYFLLTSKYIRRQIESLTSGSAVPQLPARDLKKFELPNIPRNIQDSIGKIIGDITDKIELNHQTNQTLEEMAQAVFKSWFVDFEPTRAKIKATQNGQDPTRAAMAAIAGKTIDQLDTLSPEQIETLTATAALFPDALVTSELGEIPEGWEVKALDQIAHYQNGLALQKFRPENEREFLPVLKITQLKRGIVDGAEKASPQIRPECIVNNGDVIFSWSGSLVVDVWCGGVAALNQHLFKVTSEHYPKWFYYYWTKHHLESFQQIAADKAVTMGHIKRSHLAEAQCVVPKEPLQNIEVVKELLEKQIKQRLESQTLTEIRDTLLPKLLSGELEVTNGD